MAKITPHMLSSQLTKLSRSVHEWDQPTISDTYDLISRLIDKPQRLRVIGPIPDERDTPIQVVFPTPAARPVSVVLHTEDSRDRPPVDAECPHCRRKITITLSVKRA